MDKLCWCFKKKESFEIIKPNNNLAEAYLKKAEDSLNEMLRVETKDWKISTAYYSMYYSVYAILMKLGLKSEIHSCTIEFTKEHLKEYFSKEDLELLEDAFDARNDLQYYTDRTVKMEIYNSILKNCISFKLKCKNIVQKITLKEIEEIRKKLTILKTKCNKNQKYGVK